MIRDDLNRRLSQIVKKRHVVEIVSSGEGMYGENTEKSLLNLYDVLQKKYLLNKKDSIFLDIGSGRGLPSFVAVMHDHVKAALGVESDSNSYRLCLSHLVEWLRFLTASPVIKESERPASAAFVLQDAATLESIAPVTHVFSFDLAMPQHLIDRFVDLFNKTNTALVYVSFRKDMSNFHLEAQLVEKIPMAMKGSSEFHSAYIYVKPVALRTVYPVDAERFYTPSVRQNMTVEMVFKWMGHTMGIHTVKNYLCSVCGRFTKVPLVFCDEKSAALLSSSQVDTTLEESTTSTKCPNDNLEDEDENCTPRKTSKCKSEMKKDETPDNHRTDLWFLFNLAMSSVKKQLEVFNIQLESSLISKPKRMRSRSRSRGEIGKSPKNLVSNFETNLRRQYLDRCDKEAELEHVLKHANFWCKDRDRKRRRTWQTLTKESMGKDKQECHPGAPSTFENDESEEPPAWLLRLSEVLGVELIR